MSEHTPEFYIGYKESAPTGIARHVRRVVLVLIAVALAIAVLLISAGMPFSDAHFEYGTIETFEGVVSARPYPVLAVTSPANWSGRTALLVSFGKRGAEARVEGLDARRVRLDGQRIYRGSDSMIELSDADIEDLGAGARGAVEKSLGSHELAGEIVDSKCHLGVMKPGNGKPHRGCATRCISGGSPPILWVRDRSGTERHYLLEGTDGRQLGRELLDLVAEPVEIRGEVIHRNALWILRTEPQAIRRVTAEGD